ncbi:hypothetical protein J6590_019386 [Homalodisca vitripennis]|nr:hypothetical protein J6590_019386 [Homalodisca vitripennis]
MREIDIIACYVINVLLYVILRGHEGTRPPQCEVRAQFVETVNCSSYQKVVYPRQQYRSSTFTWRFHRIEVKHSLFLGDDGNILPVYSCVQRFISFRKSDVNIIITARGDRTTFSSHNFLSFQLINHPF